MRTYAEPFAGGAAVFFALAAERVAAQRGARSYERAVLCDQNEDLIACYRAVQKKVDDLCAALRAYRYDKDLFYEVRDADPSAMDDVTRGARLIFLNRTCYNGLWRVNSRGKFNVPFGRYKNPRILDEARLRAASAALRGAEILSGDYARVTSELGPGDFVYLDPPYAPAGTTADFTAYGPGGFGPDQQVRLAREFGRLRERGVLAILSNADTADTRALYKDFACHVVHAPRPINSNVHGRGAARELLVCTWGTAGVRPGSA